MGGNPRIENPRVTTTFAEHSGTRFNVYYPEPAFHDKDTYLKWRADWKKNYTSLSLEIKRVKIERDYCRQEKFAAQATVMLEQLEDAKCKAAFQVGKPRARRYHHTYKSPACDICGVNVRNSAQKKDGKYSYEYQTTAPQPQASAE